MEVSIKKLAYRAGIKAPDLLTRYVGKVLYVKLTEAVKHAANGEIVVLDFTGIEVIDSSFVDEFIVKFVLDQNKTDRYYVRLRNISKTIQLNIDAVFKSYLKFDKRRLVVITEDICINNRFYIGMLSDTEGNILNYIRVNKSVDIDDAKLSLKASKEVLDGMCELGIIRKDGSRFLLV